MIVNQPLFDQLIHEAWDHDFSGWDFSHISQRMLEAAPDWDFRRLALDKIKSAGSLLDLDTGGGEFLASLQPLPSCTCATEGYAPNVSVARARLEPLGIQVYDTLANVPLPFPGNSFDLVINRHGDYLGSELHRILRPGGVFLTQQVGGKNNLDLNEMLQDRIEFRYSYWTLDCAAQQLEKAGLVIVDRDEAYPRVEFLDIGAVVYYLKVISWQVEGFDLRKYYNRLAAIHNIIQQQGRFVSHSHYFYIEACKP